MLVFIVQEPESFFLSASILFVELSIIYLSSMQCDFNPKA